MHTSSHGLKYNINGYLKVSFISENTRFRDFSCFNFQVIISLPRFKCQSLSRIRHYLIFFWGFFFFNSMYGLSSQHGLCLLKEKCLHAPLKFSVCDIRASLKGAHVPVLDKPSVTRMLESSRFQADKHLFVCSLNRMWSVWVRSGLI